MTALNRDKNFENAARRRSAEANDAFDFRWETDENRHHNRCLFAQRGQPVCARVYDPRPEGRDSEPADLSLYESTGIGYLYGEDHTDQFAWELAGWTLQREGSL